jgi:hypothetical protein
VNTRVYSVRIAHQLMSDVQEFVLSGSRRQAGITLTEAVRIALEQLVATRRRYRRMAKKKKTMCGHIPLLDIRDPDQQDE